MHESIRQLSDNNTTGVNKFWSVVSQRENILVRSVLLEFFDPVAFDWYIGLL